MASKRLPPRQCLSPIRLATAALLLVAALMVVMLPAANAQQYDRRGRPPPQNFFNPFSIFTPLFRGGPRQQPGGPLRQQYPGSMPEVRTAPSVSADYSRAPPPRKTDTTPTQSVVVMGSSLADWLSYGLEDAYADRPEIGIVRKIRPYSGLIRYDQHGNTDWAQAARDIVKEQNADVVVMLIGLMDRQPIRTKTAAGESAKPDKRQSGGVLEYRTDEWATAYEARIDETIAALKSKGVPVIWVGLPSVRGAKSTSDMIYLNDLFRARAEHANIVYVDVWDGFVDDSGRFTTYGPDVEGQARRLRTSDGVYFTKAGARKLAHYVEREINRLIGAKLPAVATAPAGDDATNPAAPRPDVPAARPLAGPVLPLTDAASASTLAGGDARPGVADPLARRVLINGDAVTGPSGRSDNFFVTPELAAAAAAASAVPTASVAATPAKPPAAADTAALVRQEAPPAAVVTPKSARAPEVSAREPEPASSVNRATERRTPPPSRTAQQFRPRVQKPQPTPRDPRAVVRRPPRAQGSDPLGMFR